MSDETISADVGRGTIWVGVVLGWLAALGAGLILGVVVGAVVSVVSLVFSGSGGEAGSGMLGFFGVLLTLLLAYFVGGYTAGLIAGRSGIRHGFLVALLSLAVTVVMLVVLLSVVGTVSGQLGADLANLASFADLAGIELPALLVALSDPRGFVGEIPTAFWLLVLLCPFVGGTLGGAQGAGARDRLP